MRDALLIRPATGDDEAFAREAHHLGMHDVVERQFGAWDERAQDVFFADLWRRDGVEIVEVDGERCGYVFVEDGDDHVTVGEIVLHPAFHGRGIGTVLLERAIAGADDRGVPVRLQVLHENRRARALYERVGFAESGRTPTHVLMERAPRR